MRSIRKVRGVVTASAVTVVVCLSGVALASPTAQQTILPPLPPASATAIDAQLEFYATSLFQYAKTLKPSERRRWAREALRAGLTQPQVAKALGNPSILARLVNPQLAVASRAGASVRLRNPPQSNRSPSIRKVSTAAFPVPVFFCGHTIPDCINSIVFHNPDEDDPNDPDGGLFDDLGDTGDFGAFGFGAAASGGTALSASKATNGVGTVALTSTDATAASEQVPCSGVVLVTRPVRTRTAKALGSISCSESVLFQLVRFEWRDVVFGTLIKQDDKGDHAARGYVAHSHTKKGVKHQRYVLFCASMSKPGYTPASLCADSRNADFPFSGV
jgi:hypothetical protein